MEEPVIRTPTEYDSLRARAPEFLGDLMDHVTEVLTEGGIPADTAAIYGLAVSARLRARWAKQFIYFPEGRDLMARVRNAKIYEEFDGRNHNHLAAKYNVSVTWIYRIVEALRAEHTAGKQADLDLG